MASLIKRREKWYARVVWRVSGKLKEIQIPLQFKKETITKYIRSEEHTSELQSRRNLVCRLLLEKKKHI